MINLWAHIGKGGLQGRPLFDTAPSSTDDVAYDTIGSRHLVLTTGP